DGQSSVLVGDPLELAVSGKTEAVKIVEKNSTDLVIEGGACQKQPFACLETSEAPMCKPEVIGFSSTFSPGVRPTSRRAPATSRPGKMSARAGGVFELADSAVDFDARRVKSGDQVQLQLAAQTPCALTSSITVTATTTTTAADRLTLVFDAPPPALED